MGEYTKNTVMRLIFAAFVLCIAAVSALPKTGEKNDFTCSLCQKIITEIENQISEALAGICDAILHIPEDIMACKDIIEELIPEFINAIINNWGDHDAICKEIFLCP